jgi:hypothetical protein
MIQTTPLSYSPFGRRAAPLIALTFLTVLWCHTGVRAQNAPTGPAGGDLSGTYPNPGLAVDRVRKTGDTINGSLNITLPNPGAIVTPFSISSPGNALLNRGVAMLFNVPGGSSTTLLGGRITSAWGSNAQTYMSFSAYNSGAFNEIFRLDGRGFFGIGTSNPTSKLHVASGTDSLTTMLHLDTGIHGGTAFAVGGNANNESTFDLSVYRAGTYYSRLGVTGAGNLFLQPGAGNVGVGTTIPGYRFDVQGGQINASGGLCIAGICKVSWSEVAGGSGGTQWTTLGSNITYNSGNVGVGMSTAPAYKLDVAGQVRSSSGFVFPDNTVQMTAAGGTVTGVTAGLGLTGGGTAGALTLTNSDRGSTQNIFKNVSNAAGVTQFSAASNSDAVRFEGTGGTTVSFDPAAKKVTINSAAPASTLTAENVSAGQFGANTGGGNFSFPGNVTVTGNISAKYQDVAEWVPSVQQLKAGTVVVLDAVRRNHVLASSQAYDTSVAGVVSAQPGLILGEGGEGKVMVATTGRVKVKVDATRGPVRIGDLLVTGEAEGMAMKSVPLDFGGTPVHRPGTIIGKALEPLEKGIGEILVLLSMQ